MYQVRIISVHSFAAHKTVGLKAQIAVLGSRLLPVPSIIMNGVASNSHIETHPVDFIPVLDATMQLSLLQKQKVFLFIGYVALSVDILKLVDFINKHRQNITGVIVDPISGDSDKPYIDQSVIELWPQILSLAHIAFPNLTEIKLYSGLPIAEKSIAKHIEAFENRFPKLDYVLTSYCEGKKFGVLLKYQQKHLFIKHKFYKTKIDGTGDLFASFYLKYYLFEDNNPLLSCRKALNNILILIQRAVKNHSSELEL